MFSNISQYDFQLLDFIQFELHSSLGDILMPYITILGDNGAIWILIALSLLLSKKHRVTGMKISIALILGLIIGNLFLKPVIARIRPYDINMGVSLLIPKLKDYSFPSGHTMSSFAAATVLFLANKKTGTPALIMAGLIAYSRLYLYVHFPTDVFAGALLGILFAFASVKIADPLRNKLERFGIDFQ